MDRNGLILGEVFIVSNMDRVSIRGEFMSHGTYISSLLLTIAHISNIEVVISSCVRFLPYFCKIMAFMIIFTVLISLSHASLCGAFGGLNFQVVRELDRNFDNGPFLINTAYWTCYCTHKVCIDKGWLGELMYNLYDDCPNAETGEQYSSTFFLSTSSSIGMQPAMGQTY